MLWLSKFYHLLHKSATVVLYDADTGDWLWEGPVRNIPKEYDSRTVADFCATDWGHRFYLNKEA